MSSRTEALISEVFKRPVLWDHRNKNYHNRDFVDERWWNLSQRLHLCLVCTQIYVQICRTGFLRLHSVMTTLNYCTSPRASISHGTEPAGLWKNPQNMSRVCLAEAVTELCILDFFNWVPPFASRLWQSFDEESCKPSTSMIILCNKAMHFTISRPVFTSLSMALSGILHFEARIPKADSTTLRARDGL